jgi:hypothetical protein
MGVLKLKFDLTGSQSAVNFIVLRAINFVLVLVLLS